jgi:hypothetical protein
MTVFIESYFPLRHCTADMGGFRSHAFAALC